MGMGIYRGMGFQLSTDLVSGKMYGVFQIMGYQSYGLSQLRL